MNYIALTSRWNPGTLCGLALSESTAEDAIALNVFASNADVAGEAARTRGHASAGDGVTSNGEDLHVRASAGVALGVVVDLGDVLDEGGSVTAAGCASRGSAWHVQEGF